MLTKKDAVIALHISNDTALRELNVLIKHHLIIKQGVGKNISYILHST